MHVALVAILTVAVTKASAASLSSTECAVIPECVPAEWANVPMTANAGIGGGRFRRNNRVGRGAQSLVLPIQRLPTQSTPKASGAVDEDQFVVKVFTKQRVFERESRALACLADLPSIHPAECIFAARQAIVFRRAPLGDLLHGPPLATRFASLEAADLEMRKREWFSEVAANMIIAVWRMHHRGWTHHDIKPNNVLLLDSSMDLSLIEFGLAMPRGQERASHGTKFTKAPEQLLLSAGTRQPVVVTSAVDWWSLGVTLWFVHCSLFYDHLENLISSLNPAGLKASSSSSTEFKWRDCIPYRVVEDRQGQRVQQRMQDTLVRAPAEALMSEKTQTLLNQVLMNVNPEGRHQLDQPKSLRHLLELLILD